MNIFELLFKSVFQIFLELHLTAGIDEWLEHVLDF